MVTWRANARRIFLVALVFGARFRGAGFPGDGLTWSFNLMNLDLF